MSKNEITGWRDEKISRRHRDWENDLPAIDLDFILIEYDKGEPKALIEYKNENAPSQNFNLHSYQALIKLGTRAELPVFFCRYYIPDVDLTQSPLSAADEEKIVKLSWYFLIPLNDLAKRFNFPERKVTERTYRNWLLHIRNRSSQSINQIPWCQS